MSSSTGSIMERNIDPETVQVTFTENVLKVDDVEETDHPERSTSRPTVHDLPSELLMELFTWFSVRELCVTISPVCKKWHLTSQDKFLWKHLSFKGQGLSTERLCSLLSHATQLQSLQLVNRVDANVVLQQVATSNRSLQILIVKQCKGSPQDFLIKEKVILNLINSCSKLVELAIDRTYFYSRTFFNVIAVALPYLKRINLHNNLYFGSRSLNIMACNCKPLEEVSIFWPNMLRIDSSLSTESDIKDIDIYELCTRMKYSLKLLKVLGQELTDNSIKSMVQCTCLHTLDIVCATRLSDNGILLLTTLRNIIVLNVSCAQRVSSEGWHELFIRSKWHSMRKLSLSSCNGVDDKVLEIIGESCLNLQSICLTRCTHFTEYGLSKLIKGCNELIFLSVNDTHINVYECFPLLPTYTPYLRCLVPYDINIEWHKEILEDVKQTLFDLQNKLPTLEIRSKMFSKIFNNISNSRQ